MLSFAWTIYVKRHFEVTISPFDFNDFIAALLGDGVSSVLYYEQPQHA